MQIDEFTRGYAVMTRNEQTALTLGRRGSPRAMVEGWIRSMGYRKPEDRPDLLAAWARGNDEYLADGKDK